MSLTQISGDVVSANVIAQALTSNTVPGSVIINNSITAQQIANSSITPTQISTVSNTQVIGAMTNIGYGVINTVNISNGVVTPALLSTGAPYWNTSSQVMVGTTNPTTYYSGSNQIYPNMIVQGDYDNLYLSGYTTRPGLNFAGPNSASNRFRFAAIQGAFSTTTAGSEGGGLSFQTATNGANISEKAYLSTQGYFTTPYNPAFCYGGVASSSYTAPNAVKFNSKFFDTTNSYNSSTGVFTAPVTGTYFFSSVILVQGTSSGQQFDLQLVQNGTTSAGWYAAPGRITNSSPGTTWGDGYIALGANQTVQMIAGDSIYVSFGTFGGGSIYSGTTWTRFHGFLIG